MEAVIALALITLAAWDARRRTLEDRRLAREFERKTTTELAEKLHGLTLAIEKDRRVQADALENFLKQMREIARFSAEKQRELEMRAAGKKLP